ncbi:peptidase M15 [Bacteroidia bacterium]|nr:peptidase M15 [Bacteroidia bacterium]
MKYFSIKELCQSGVAKKYGIDLIPNDWESENLKSLIDNLLDPIRNIWEKPLYITNAFRPQQLIDLMKKEGYKVSNTTQHKYGFCADFTTGNKSDNEKLFNVLAHRTDLKYDQLLDENSYSWIHIGEYKLAEYDNRESGKIQRNQILHI